MNRTRFSALRRPAAAIAAVARGGVARGGARPEFSVEGDLEVRRDHVPRRIGAPPGEGLLSAQSGARNRIQGIRPAGRRGGSRRDGRRRAGGVSQPRHAALQHAARQGPLAGHLRPAHQACRRDRRPGRAAETAEAVDGGADARGHAVEEGRLRSRARPRQALLRSGAGAPARPCRDWRRSTSRCRSSTA